MEELQKYLDRLKIAITEERDLNSEFGIYGDNDAVYLGGSFNGLVRKLIGNKVWKPSNESKKQVRDYLRRRSQVYEIWRNAQDESDPLMLRISKPEIRIPDKDMWLNFDNHTELDLKPINDINDIDTYWKIPPFNLYRTFIILHGGWKVGHKKLKSLRDDLCTGKTILYLGELVLQGRIPFSVGKITHENCSHFQ